jgi:hypothetical protein
MAQTGPGGGHCHMATAKFVKDASDEALAIINRNVRHTAFG